MKKIAYFIGSCAGILISLTSLSEAAVIVLNNMNTAMIRQPVTAVIVDTNGNSFEQTYYYEPSLNGVDIGLTNPGESIYFPDYNARYLWNNGYWVNEQGYYWNNGRYTYVDHPHWHDHWHGYWNNHRGNYSYHSSDVTINNYNNSNPNPKTYNYNQTHQSSQPKLNYNSSAQQNEAHYHTHQTHQHVHSTSSKNHSH
jgi:hypothetical protein